LAADVADDLSPGQRLRIQQQLAANLGSPALRRAVAARKAAAAVPLQWPLRSLRDDGSGYHGISNFVDHDPAFPDRVRDYACGARTYDDTHGYNHAGTDYFLWPFPWLTMDDGVIAAVAAAPGIVAGRSDGHPDRSCAMGDLPWNAVYLRHDDGSVTWYGHLRRGSLTDKQIGDAVEAGEYLGLVGSSGSSTGPHLHFELHDATGRVVDPRHGDCNAEPERWSPPQAYEDPAINTLSLHTQEPEWLSCGDGSEGATQEHTYASDAIAPGTTFHALASFRDQRRGDVATFALQRPDGSEFARWQHDLADEDLPRDFYAGTAWSWSHTLPAEAPHGYWHFVADFHGRHYTHAFYVGSENEARAAAVLREGAAVQALTPAHRPERGDP
uniref:M23 family metallopeptidase n=1 Tax=Tahibacter caeni TaxID=1453545 RepID=UPI0021490AD8